MNTESLRRTSCGARRRIIGPTVLIRLVAIATLALSFAACADRGASRTVSQDAGGTIAGVVRNGDGAPLAGCNITATSAHIEREGSTASDGTYVINADLAGRYIVAFGACAVGGVTYAGEFFDGKAQQSDATEVAVGAGQAVDHIDAGLEVGGSIGGTVTDSAGTPLSGCHVTVQPAVTPASGAAVTGVDGRYVVAGLATGTYVVESTKCVIADTTYSAASYDRMVTVALGKTSTGIDLRLEKGGAIAGTISAVGGALVDNCRVSAEAIPEDWAAQDSNEVVTDSEGNYRIDGLRSARYYVLVDCMPDHVRQYFDHKPDRSSADKVQVTAPATTTVNTTVDTGGSLFGLIRNNDGIPLPDCSVVAIWGATSDPQQITASSDEFGRYRFRGLSAGSYILSYGSCTVGSTTYAGQYSGGVANATDALPIKVENGKITPFVDAQLDAAGSIEGTVRNFEGTPLSACIVTASGPDNGETTTGTDGHFHIWGLRPASYVVTFYSCAVDGTLYIGTYYDGTADQSQASPVLVTSGNATSGINASLGIPTSIAGTVRDRHGTLLEGCFVGALEESSNYIWVNAQTDSNGHYRFEGLNPGHYLIEFNGCQVGSTVYFGEYWRHTPDQSAANQITLTGRPVDGIDGTLQVGGTISGTVTTTAGRPVSSCDVLAIESGSSNETAEQTDADGRYTIRDLEPGTYKVKFSCNGTDQFFRQKANQESADLVTVATEGVVSGVDASFPSVAPMK